jgi:hypothetical protein
MVLLKIQRFVYFMHKKNKNVFYQSKQWLSLVVGLKIILYTSSTVNW